MPPKPRTSWRLIQTPPDHGAWNMAVDEAIFEAAGRGEVPPTLRLYAWQPACLSLGYAQSITDVNFAGLAANGWEWVRRPTGGRAILHIDELTYSVTGSQDEPLLRGSILESYRALSAALLDGLHRLGIPAQALPKNGPRGQSASGAEPNPVCFETPSDYEITVAGKKLIGSAQARRNFSANPAAASRPTPTSAPSAVLAAQRPNGAGTGGVLQHGSLPLCGDLTRIVTALNFPDESAQLHAAERLLQRATTAELVLGRELTWAEAAQALCAAFTQTLDLDLNPGELTSSELLRAKQLFAEKYSSKSWNEKS